MVFFFFFFFLVWFVYAVAGGRVMKKEYIRNTFIVADPIIGFVSFRMSDSASGGNGQLTAQLVS